MMAEQNKSDEWADAEQLISYGSTVKALGDGKVAGYLVRFTSPDELDLEGEYFDAETDYDFKDGERTALYYHHGSDKTVGRRKIGDGVLTMKDAGVWLEGQLEMRDGYERAIAGMADKERLGFSSGTAPHLVEREPIEDGKGYHITRWPLRLDASLTPTPADPGNRVMTLKTYQAQTGHVKALEPEDASRDASAPEDKPAANKSTDSKPHGGKTMGIKAFLIGGQWYAYKTDESGARVGDPLKAGSKEDVDTYIADLQTPDEIKIAKALATQVATSLQPLTKAVSDVTARVKMIAGRDDPGYSADPTKAWATVKGDLTYNFGDFLFAIKANDRGLLEKIYTEQNDTKALKVLGEQTQAAGGALVPIQFRAELIRFEAEDEVVYPRARVVPTTGPVSLPGLSTAGSTAGQPNVFGGVWPQATRSGETKHTSEPSFRDIELNPKELSVYASVKDQLIRRSAISLTEVLLSLFRESLSFARDEWFLDGNGATQAQGIMTSNGTLVQARVAAGAIGYLDLVRMKQHFYLRSWMGGYWVFHISCYEELAQIKDPQGAYIWQRDAIGGEPATVLGLPYRWTEKTATLGTQGDVLLIDPRYYYVAEEMDVTVAQSTDFLFSQNRTAFKAFLTVDGQEMLEAPLYYKDGVTQFSPFVMLGDAATG